MALDVDLCGRRVLVTGASSGLGLATCRSIVRCGGAVAMLARRKDLVESLSNELGARAVGVQVDVTDLEGLESAVGQAAAALGGLDGVVAAAGQSMTGTVTTGTPQRWRQLLDLNLIGPLAAAHYAVAYFADTGRRDIVLMGSAIALRPMPGTAIYGASKLGLRAAFDTLRLELAPSGINVGLVMPGYFDAATAGGAGTVFDGDMPSLDMPLMVAGEPMAEPAVLGDTIAFMLSLPEGVGINEIVVRPTGQLCP